MVGTSRKGECAVGEISTPQACLCFAGPVNVFITFVQILVFR